jgi:hypothetical protein
LPEGEVPGKEVVSRSGKIVAGVAIPSAEKVPRFSNQIYYREE